MEPWKALFLGLFSGLNLAAAVEDTTTAGVRCEKDKTIGDRFDFNIYYCLDPNKPQCCQVDDEYTCCETELKHSVEEQAILWGALGAIIFLVAVVCVCYHKDSRMCDSGESNGRCCRCCRCWSRKGEEKLDIIGAEAETAYEVQDGTKEAVDSKNFTGIILQTDDDSGRGSACSIASSVPISVASSSAPTPRPASQATARSDGTQSALSARAPSSARSNRSAVSERSITPEPNRLADVQL